MRRLVCAFVVPKHQRQVYNKGADQTARMRRLVCAFVVRKHQRQVFSRRGPTINLRFLCCNLRQESEENRAHADFTMVRPYLDYCSTMWSPYQCDKKHQDEMALIRSALFVTYRNTSSLGWKSQVP